MNITIISVGKIKEEFVLSGIKHYKKYLTKFAKLNFKDVPPIHIPKNASLKDIENVKELESEALLERSSESYRIALSPEGKTLTSEAFASVIEDIQTYKGSKVTFFIGGSHGIADSVKKSCDMVLSLSSMTYPHQLTALILSEQIFRAYKINNNEPYHK